MPQLLVRQKDSLVQLAIYKISKILNCHYINNYNHELEIIRGVIKILHNFPKKLCNDIVYVL